MSADVQGHALHPRGILPLLRARLESRPVTVLSGARQTGKTTLVRRLLHDHGGAEPAYFSLDDPDERLRLAADPVRRLDYGARLVVLDEVQKAPALMDAVKVLADRGGGRRFLLLGSSHILLLSQVRESLAGRAALLDLWPLALVERVQGQEVPETVLGRVWREGAGILEALAERPASVDELRTWRGLCEEHLRWGGYPALEWLDVSERSAWLRDYRKTYLERDLADLGRVSDLDQFSLAQNLFAARTAQLLSYSEVSRELGVAVNTVKRYLRFLEISYQAYVLRPLAPTMTGRVVKSPKLYWTDPGLGRLLAQDAYAAGGALYETGVLAELLKWMSWQQDPPNIHFFRTAAGREVDFVVHGPGALVAIEAKSARKSPPRAARVLAQLLDDPPVPGMRPDALRVGLVVTQGTEVRQHAERVWETPFPVLFGPAAVKG